jgi:oligoribonuclease
MKYISIDIETTGLDPETCQILQIGLVIEDTNDPSPIEDLPKLNIIVEHQVYSGQATAISMNSKLFKILGGLQNLNKEERLEYKKLHNIFPVGTVSKAIHAWLLNNWIETTDTGAISINAAGKNFATFDKLFLEKLPSWSSNIQIKQRVIDPAILLTDWLYDKSMPNLGTCMNRCKLDGEVTHDAVQDAIDVIRVIRSVTDTYTKKFF